MIRLDFKITGEGQVLSGMVKAEGAAISRIRESVAVQTLKLQRRVKGQKLSGQVLKVRTGTLRRSIGQEVNDTGSAIVGIVSTNTKYAPAHEFGATIPARIVEAKRAAALRFKIGGRTVFAKSVSIPSFKLPERSFLRSSLAEMERETEQAIAVAANGPGVNL